MRASAIHLRVDSVEEALKMIVVGITPAEDAGYLAIAASAKDNLSLGVDVISDTVNPLEITRRLLVQTAAACGAKLLNVEVVCSDRALHRARVEARKRDIEGLVVPGWQKVSNRKFEPWKGERLIVDTSTESIGASAAAIVKKIASLRSEA